MFFKSRWNSLSGAFEGSARDLQSSATKSRFKAASLFMFLLPLIVILGTVDIVTKGRTRYWP